MIHAIRQFLNPFAVLTRENRAYGNYVFFSDGRKPVHADEFADAQSIHYLRENDEITAAQAQWHLKIWNCKHVDPAYAQPYPVSGEVANVPVTLRAVRQWGDRYRTLNLKKMTVYALLAGAALKMSMPQALMPTIAGYVSLAAAALFEIAGERTLAFVPGGYLVGSVGGMLARDILSGRVALLK